MEIKNLFFFALLCSINSHAQVDVVEDEDAINIVDVVGNSPSIYSPAIDTLHLHYGKPKVLLLQIDSQSNQYSSVGNDIEIKELRKNFSKNDFDLNHITNQAYITLENGQFVDVSDIDASYGAVVFWSGKKNDKLLVQEGTRKCTEFVSENLGMNKKSSYLLNDEMLKKEIANLPTKDKFTDNSKILMQQLLRNYSTSKSCFIDDVLVFNHKQLNVKSITGFLINSKGKKIKKETIFLNTFGNSTKISFFDDDGSTPYAVTEFIYENDILKEIIKNDNTEKIHYNDNQLFYTSDLGGAEETVVFSLKNDNLLVKRLLIMKEDGAEEQNSLVDERLDKNCINYYINDELWTTKCHSASQVFPFVLNYTSFQEGQVLQKIDYKITKINDAKYELSTNNNTSDKGIKTIFTLNNRGLLESMSYKDGNHIEKYQLEYTYFD